MLILISVDVDLDVDDKLDMFELLSDFDVDVDSYSLLTVSQVCSGPVAVVAF
jgi:hypothetical protein